MRPCNVCFVDTSVIELRLQEGAHREGDADGLAAVLIGVLRRVLVEQLVSIRKHLSTIIQLRVGM